MKKYKKFVFILLFIIIFFISFHFIMWQFTKLVYPKNYTVGDLARMSYRFDLITKREDQNTLNKKHINFNDYENEIVDLITIGDSFSNGGAGGPNRYYQDYIASIYDLKVLNILKLPESKDYLDTLVVLLNNGFFDKIKVKYVLVESVQRNTYENLGFNNIGLISNLKFDDIILNIKNNKDIYNSKDKYGEKLTFINNLNYNVLLYNIQFYINGYGEQKKYYIDKLNNDFFTSKVKDELIFFKDDIKFLKYETKDNLENLNNKLNLLSSLLKEKGIKLYYMAVVDKYNLYRDYLIDKNSYPESIFFEYFRTLKKDYTFIDTKEILLNELKSSEKDIFYSDDTHWNYRASEVIVKKINFN
jgi:hypothetical protein